MPRKEEKMTQEARGDRPTGYEFEIRVTTPRVLDPVMVRLAEVGCILYAAFTKPHLNHHMIIDDAKRTVTLMRGRGN